MKPRYYAVTYVMRGPAFGLMAGWVIMAIRPATIGEIERAAENGKLKVLKVWAEFYDAIVEERKNFEVRVDDRDPPYDEGDVLELNRTVPPAPPAGEKPCDCEAQTERYICKRWWPQAHCPRHCLYCAPRPRRRKGAKRG